MKKTTTIILLVGLIAILSCSIASGRRLGKKDFCQLPTESGRCRGSHVRWYYDSASGECRNFTWGGCGGNNNRFDSKSICEIVCKPGCRYNRCNTTCLNGYIIDADGCNTCRCQPGSDQSSCPQIECPNRCPHGYLINSNGCTTCQCKTEQVQAQVNRIQQTHVNRTCPPVCYKFCQYGNKRDENGCDICACKSKEEVCGPQQCMMECPTGFKTDTRGCDLCECNPAAESEPTCQINKCFKECAFGFQKDSFGCEVCVCATSRQRIRNRNVTDCSSRPRCFTRCPNGFLKGRDGCDICRCASRSYPERRHDRIERRFGKNFSSDDVCGVRSMCMMACPNGFVKDRRGCDTCNCLPTGHVAHRSNRTSELPAQLPENIPPSQTNDTSSQLPVDVPAHLPTSNECTRKRCHKHMDCAFGFAKDQFGCDTCVCGGASSRSATKRRGSN